MARSSYLSASDEGFAAQLNTFKDTIGGYATVLGLSATALAAQAADADYFSYTLAVKDLMTNSARQWTAWKDLIRGGGNQAQSGAPAPLNLPAPVAAVAPGIESRFRALVKQVKASSGYNSSIGAALGIEGAEQTGPDYATLAPRLSATINGTRVDVGWDWGGYREFLAMCELQVDRGDDKGFIPLAFDTTPGYVDTEPFPAKPAKWTYQAIYRQGDNRVGQWSSPASITVGGKHTCSHGAASPCCVNQTHQSSRTSQRPAASASPGSARIFEQTPRHPNELQSVVEAGARGMNSPVSASHSLPALPWIKPCATASIEPLEWNDPGTSRLERRYHCQLSRLTAALVTEGIFLKAKSVPAATS